MWIFGRHRHLSHEVLSEYLDGRLRGSQRERVSRQLNSCAFCREELEGLRATISLLRDLPDLPVPRSFTLAGPLPLATAQRPPRSFRAPSWAYAGAASLAGLALAVLVSADVTGLLTPSGLSSAPETFTTQALQAPAPTPAPQQPTPAPATTDAQPESAQALRAAPPPKATAQPEQGEEGREAAQPPASEQDATSSEATATPQAPAAEDAGAAAPQGPAGPAGASGGPATEDSQPDEPDGGATAPGGEDAPALAQSEPEVDAARAPVSEPGPVSELAAVDETGTPLLWRVLEGVAAALLLLFLTVFFWQRRKSRQASNN